MQHRIRLLCLAAAVGTFFFTAPQTCQSEENSPQLSSLMLSDAFQKGVDYFLTKKYDEAEKVFRHCLQREPSNAEYTCWLAQTMGLILGERAMKGASPLSMLSDGRKVKDLYSKAMELDPQNERARIGHAVILRDIPGWLGGSVKKAEQILREVLKDNPQNLSAKHFLGTLYIRKHKKYEEGIEILDEAIEMAKKLDLTQEDKYNLYRTNHAVGKAYLENLELPEKAIPYFKQSLEIEPLSPVTLLDLVDAYREIDKEDEAKEALRTAANVIQTNEYKRFKKDLAKAAKRLDMKKELGL